MKKPPIQAQYLRFLSEQENGHLAKMHQIVQETLQEEALLTQKILEEGKEPIRFGERLADSVAAFGGSWRFILSFGGIILVWIVVNRVMSPQEAFDPFPFILLNLVLSCVAAFQAPLIMMSQNRQEKKDRQRAENDYMVNLKSEIEIRHLHEKIDLSILEQYHQLFEIQKQQIELLEALNRDLKKMKHS